MCFYFILSYSLTSFFWNNMWLGGDDKEGTVPEWRSYCKTRVVIELEQAKL